MNNLERVIAALERKTPDRVPVFSQPLDIKTVDDALERPHTPVYEIMQRPFMQKFVDHTAWLWNFLSHPNLGGALFSSDVLKAQTKIGFDAGCVGYYGLRVINHEELQDIAGRRYKFCDDGFGGIYAMYVEGIIKDPDAWKSFKKVDPLVYARRLRIFFSFLNWLWGGKIAVVASPGATLHQDITEGMGFANFVRWARKDPSFVKDIIEYKTELAVEAIRAVGLSGVRIIWFGDDLAYRSGPMLSPSMLEKFFGESYLKIASAAHAGGSKIIFHTCGNVLDLLPMIADWGFDGVHSLEPTAGVTLAEARKRIGNRLCLVGNVDITHVLVKGSRKEVFDNVRRCINEGGIEGAFILSATNTHPKISARNLSWMVEACKKYGSYPIEPSTLN